MKKSMRALAAISCILALVLGGCAAPGTGNAKTGDDTSIVQTIAEITNKSEEITSPETSGQSQQASMEEYAKELVGMIEDTHPAFSLEQVPEGYESEREAFLKTAAVPECTLADFTWAAMAYTASLKDGHTAVDPFGGVPQPYLDVEWIADGEHLYLTDEEGKVTKTEVISVGGIPTAELFAVIDRYIVAENQAGQNQNHTNWSSSPALLMKAGASFSQENTMVLEFKEGDEIKNRTVGLAESQEGGEESIIDYEMMGDVFYVDFNQCVLGEEVDGTVKALKDAVGAGTNKVVIDVRGNGGGNSKACEQLLNAMGMEVPQYGVYMRYSPLVHETYPDNFPESTGDMRYEPNPGTAKANPDIELVVLTDEVTYSSATMMGVFVQDGKLGTIIGRPSANAPNSYGDIIWLQIGDGLLSGTVSFKQFLRPDVNAAGDELVPDIVTAVEEDALQTALDYLAEE